MLISEQERVDCIQRSTKRRASFQVSRFQSFKDELLSLSTTLKR